MENQLLTMQEYQEKYAVLVKLLEQIQDQNEYILKALDNLERMPANSVPGDIAGQARANAIGEIVKHREKTNQGLLEIYGRMYCDLREVLFPKKSKIPEEMA